MNRPCGGVRVVRPIGCEAPRMKGLEGGPRLPSPLTLVSPFLFLSLSAWSIEHFWYLVIWEPGSSADRDCKPNPGAPVTKCQNGCRRWKGMFRSKVSTLIVWWGLGNQTPPHLPPPSRPRRLTTTPGRSRKKYRAPPCLPCTPSTGCKTFLFW